MSHHQSDSLSSGDILTGSELQDALNLELMQKCLFLAEAHSPLRDTNYRIGALLLNQNTGATTTGYTLEIEGNTHAEECCLIKLASELSTTEEDLSNKLLEPHSLYTTMEPCYKRLSGNLPCVERILRQKSWIKTVYVGVLEPEKFVGENPGRAMLEKEGIEVVLVKGLEEQILEVATAGHKQH